MRIKQYSFAAFLVAFAVLMMSIFLQNVDLALANPGYRLPWPPNVTWTVTQGWGGSYSHSCPGQMCYAYDFDLTEGSEVRASLGGTVAFSEGSYTRCGGYELRNEGNRVVIYHTDGTATLYLHLSQASVSPPNSVSQGSLIGLSGRTGWTNCVPHLHFQRQAQGFWITDSQPVYFDEYPGQQLSQGQSVTSQNNSPVCNPNSDQVTLFIDINYGGQCVVKGIGDYPNPGAIGLPNDSISSIRVGSNVRAILYEQDNYQGRSETFTSDDPDLSNNSIGSDTVSSVIVLSRNYQVLNRQKTFTNWFPWPWYYLFEAEDNRVIAVYLDGQFLFARPSCSRALSVGAGNHIVSYNYEDRGTGIPDVEINAWPFISPACAAPPIDPPPTGTPPPSGNDNATFVADITLPDGSMVNPGQAYVKTWRMRNTGGTTWGSGYQLAFVSGERMGAPTAVNVPTTAPGQDADISINIVAPLSSGEHTGYWRLRNPQGTYFGPTIWVRVVVQSSSPHITVFTADPPSQSNTINVCINAKAVDFPNFRTKRL